MNENENKQIQLAHIRHSLAHLLGAAILELYPTAKLTLGPAIDNGFYYDADIAETVNEKDIIKIEQKMRQIAKTWAGFEKEVVSADIAKNKFSNNEYKHELIDGVLEKGEEISLYTSGEFTDLCRGGHVESFKDIDMGGWKLDKIAGAYWRGDEKNKMLTRVYGLAFESKEALIAYETMMEEARKRDHRILGAQLKLFTTSNLVGAGLPLIQPRGMIIRKAIEDYLWDLHKDKGYSRVWTPHIAKEALYEMSGHAAKFGDELFRVQGKEEKFIMKPMNCPHHMQIFADNQFSYRDMPVRYFEPATVYRDEKSGQLSGLTRVRSITQDDGHLFCSKDQIEAEVSTIVGIIKEFYTTFSMMDGYWVSLSVRDENKDKYLGSDEVWNMSEGALEKAATANGLNYTRVEGEATFYGPKLDFMFKDAIGREWQLATIQCDFNLPERFDLSFVNQKGEKERPVVIHRAISGSLERFMGVMIEHYAGAFPVWLSPVQVAVLPVSNEHHGDYAKQVFEDLRNAGIRAQLVADDSLGKRIRNTKMQKIPYQIIIGDKEKDSNTLTIEGRHDEKIEGRTIEQFMERIQNEIKDRINN
ncbi:MAG: threonine--tRNA ligase [Candidatus Pacebacteria bacterium]|nr:threonine--tRNA ligase [Candidatus Paceibacterota bacterium]